MHQVHRYHDFSAGHRVTGHESKCQHLHGHNYRVHFTCEAITALDQLDAIGRVVDFGVVKERLCMWLEENWDHKFLAWDKDPVMRALEAAVAGNAITGGNSLGKWKESLVWLPFNPTAENMAEYLCEEVGPAQLQGTNVWLSTVRIEETAKCHATYYRVIE